MTNADICVSRLSNQGRDRSRLNSVAFTNIPATVFATVSRTRNDLPRAYSLPGLISGTIRVAQYRELSDPTEPRGSCVFEGSFNDGPSSLRPSPNNKQSDRNGGAQDGLYAERCGRTPEEGRRGFCYGTDSERDSVNPSCSHGAQCWMPVPRQ